LDGQPLEIPGTSAAVSKIAALAAAFRKAGRPIVHVVRLYRADGTMSIGVAGRRSKQERHFSHPDHPGLSWRRGLISHPAGFALDTNALLNGPQEVGPGEVVMYKPRWGAFYQTPLEDLLRRSGASTRVLRLQLPELSAHVDLPSKRARFSDRARQGCDLWSL